MKRFTITFDIVTEESSQHGDFAYNGYVTRNGETPHKRNYIPKNPHTWSLREAFDFLEEKSFECRECDSFPWSVAHPPRWISFFGSRDEYGECISFSLHPAERGSITASSMCRLARLFGCYGSRKPIPAETDWSDHMAEKRAKHDAAKITD